MLKSEYELQPWYIRIFRWCRYKPIATTIALFCLVKWIACGAKPMGEIGIPFFYSRRFTARIIWCHSQSAAEIKMGAFYHLVDLIQDLKSQ